MPKDAVSADCLDALDSGATALLLRPAMLPRSRRSLTA